VVQPGQLRTPQKALLERLGLGERLDHKPAAMSGGEQQRVTVARALMNKPKLILADEPTGNLDSKNGAELIALFRELKADEGVGFLIATHDEAVAEAADRVVHIQDGKVLKTTTPNA
ncbi:MAG: ABC transporter ATP-binding protein, partial [Bacteroidota bacterium]